MPARAANIVAFGVFVGWKNDGEKHIKELMCLQGLTYSIQKMLWKLDKQHKHKSKLQRLRDDDTIRLILINPEVDLVTESYLSIRKILKTKSKWQTLQIVKNEYLQNKQSLENYHRSIINNK